MERTRTFRGASWLGLLGRRGRAGVRRTKGNGPTKPPLFTNRGRCTICMKEVTFIAYDEWLRDGYRCEACGSIPRQRALVAVLEEVRPEWRHLTLHESSPTMHFFAQQCPGYTCSQYFPDVPPGTYREGTLCQDLEALTFPASSFDVFITQDVLEHVFDPRRACQEITRVLKPGGIHIFTAPKHRHVSSSYPRAVREHGGVRHLHPPEYHGNPVGDGRALVTWDYGGDFEGLLAEWTNGPVCTVRLRDRTLGIDGEYLEVFVVSKRGERGG